ncbi:acetyl-CoA carboxylase, carboxyltransferase subunit beta [Salinispora arenicola]|uniref:acetyl-CoA carboxylase, carboxyltransferase subunit beta n=1 Tax=Salinispora arenicola TaxID=168697 RepID=UPI0005768FD1|nr:acetyl-CoA carboxylase, carboxyltransferase subunit beta [Salinispora arenicola]
MTWAAVTDKTATGFARCPACGLITYARRLARTGRVCPECGAYGRLSAPERLGQLLDDGSATLFPADDPVRDPLAFTDSRAYPDRLALARRATGLTEAVVCARGTIGGLPVTVAVMDFGFLGGSLGTVVGDRITRAAEAALAERTPLIIVTASGGARMQEGVFSLMQMAKVSQAVAALDDAGLLTVSIITEPTFGGVAASFATCTDVLIAEPGARMGFAGPRVIEQTVRERLPEGFQTAGFLLEHGMIDMVVPRGELRPVLGRLLAVTRPAAPSEVPDGVIRDPATLPEVDAWDVVRAARDPARPTTLDYATTLLDGFVELHGDRLAGDCPAIVGGVGVLRGRPALLLGQQKGHDTRELVSRRFGMASPEGYRKSSRLLRLAAKLGLPVMTLVDTPGAYPGIGAEQRGQALAIAEIIKQLCSIPVPVVSVVTGEGGSGGALALAVADRVLCRESGFYSVISPEGCSAILWKDVVAAPQAARALRLGARHLLASSVVDGVVPEPSDPAAALAAVGDAVAVTLSALDHTDRRELVAARRARFRRY